MEKHMFGGKHGQSAVQRKRLGSWWETRAIAAKRSWRLGQEGRSALSRLNFLHHMKSANEKDTGYIIGALK
eukprot:4513021-Pleurochrysis_carterae.AAC.1